MRRLATDMGRPGPDYLHGFGMLDLAAALTCSKQTAPGRRGSLTSNVSAATPERFFVLASDGVADIKATLCWSDQPGDILAAKALVNDLDLRLVRAADQTVFLPFALDPAHRRQPAVSSGQQRGHY